MTARPLLIAGFHRSGTSAVARALSLAGLDFGTNLLGSGPNNPHGHFEDLDVVAAHDATLERFDLTWKSTTPCPATRPELQAFIENYVDAREPIDRWAIKDPRLCLFLGDWLDQIADALVVVVVRQPGAAISSLHRRHARRFVDTRRVDSSDITFWQDPDLGLKLWLHYGRQLLSNIERVPSENLMIVNFDHRIGLANLPARCNARWDLALSEEPTGAIDSELGHTPLDSPIEVRDARLIDQASELFRQFSL